MPDALSLSRTELPEEIEKAIITLCRAEGSLGNLSLTGRNYQRAMTAAYEAREALTAAILSRLGEAEARREGAQGAPFGTGSSPSGPAPSDQEPSAYDPSRSPPRPLRYSVILKWSDEDQVFVGRVPELPGCCFHGDNQVEAIGEAASAIACWIEAAEAAGNPIPDAVLLDGADFPPWSPPAQETEARRAETLGSACEGSVAEGHAPDLTEAGRLAIKDA